MPSKPNTRALRIGAAGLAAAASLAIGGTAAAQEETEESSGGIAEIVVTAQFREQSLQDTPLAITAVDAALMESRNQGNVQDVAQRAPSVQFSAGGQGGGAQTAAVNIRGIGSTDFMFPNEPGVGIYIDDVYYGISYGTAFDLVDLDRVEILRGPQGTLSGKNSIGGSIKLFSRKPGEDSDAHIEANAGSFGRLGMRAATNATLVPGKLYMRLTGVSKYVDGYLDRLDYECVTGNPTPGGSFAAAGRGCRIGTEGGQNVLAGRAALRWIVSDRVEDSLIADLTRDRSQASAAKAYFLPPINGNDYVTGPEDYSNYATYTGYPGQAQQYTNPAISHLNSWGFSNTLDIDLNDALALKSITAFRRADGENSWDADNSPEAISNNYNYFEHEQFTQELRLSVNLADRAELTVGGYYYKGDSLLFNRINVGVAGLDFNSDDPFEQTSQSLFAHGVLHATERFNVTAGVRYTDEDKTYTFHRSNPIPGQPTDPRVASLDGLERSFKGDRVDWRVALDLEIIDDVRLYAQVATGFKGGGVNPRPYLAQQLVPFEQETATSYEVGVKSMLFDRRLRLNAAYYHTDYEGYQGLVSSCPDISPPGFPFCSATRNVGDAEIDGFEVELELNPLAALAIDGSVSYTDFEFVSGLAGSGIVPGVTEATFVPEWKYAIGAQYEFALGNAGSLTPRLDWSWQSSMQSNIPNNTAGFLLGEVDARGLLNARLTFRTTDENWEFSLAATNLTDKFYYVNKYDRVSQSGNAYGQPGRPREIIAGVKRRF